MEFVFEYGMFLLKTLTFVVAAAIVIGLIAANSMKQGQSDGTVEVESINDELDELRDTIKAATLDEKSYKAEIKARKKNAKKQKRSKLDSEKCVYVVDFNGDMRASGTEQLRREITTLLSVATPQDEVVVMLESPGGVVYGYGLAASQLARVRDKGIPLTVCVDKVAASGGYMMACIANKVVAAPFAMIGSIGVVAQIPNFHKVLQKHDIDYELHTAGNFKRTLTMFGENTDEGRQKFLQELEDTHILFKEFVRQYRPQLDIDAVATGEVWFGSRALERGLVDSLGTSDDYLVAVAESAKVYKVKYKVRKNWQNKLGIAAETAIHNVVERQLSNLWNNRFR